MYHLLQFPYCGLSMPPAVFDHEEAARNMAAALLRRRRSQGFPVSILARGREWEVGEPEGAALVPDQCGTVELSHQTFECRECGTEHETRDDSRQCCEEV